MRPRKTVNVALVLNRANAHLRLSSDANTEGRRAVAGLLESVLMDTDTYRGYGYITSSFDEHGVYQSSESTRYVQGVTDETRRQYYTHPVLKVTP